MRINDICNLLSDTDRDADDLIVGRRDQPVRILRNPDHIYNLPHHLRRDKQEKQIRQNRVADREVWPQSARLLMETCKTRWAESRKTHRNAP